MPRYRIGTRVVKENDKWDAQCGEIIHKNGKKYLVLWDNGKTEYKYVEQLRTEESYDNFARQYGDNIRMLETYFILLDEDEMKHMASIKTNSSSSINFSDMAIIL